MLSKSQIWPSWNAIRNGDVATVLFTKFLKFDPSSPDWIDRDRFILSAGHGSMLLCAISHLVGYKDSSIKQIKFQTTRK